MINWYYVVGSERVGPVSESALKVMFIGNQINAETYVWRKGFANWERLRDVSELNFENAAEEIAAGYSSSNALDSIVTEDLTFKTIESQPVKKETKKEENSPEINFSFGWNKVREDEELFFVKVGKDRKDGQSNIYGPYSMIELKEALEQKRINTQSLIFAAGMKSWTKIQETPLHSNSKDKKTDDISLNEVPLMLVFNHSPQPLVTLIKKAGTLGGILLGAGPFSEFEEGSHNVSLYVGNELKVKNVTVEIGRYDKKDQSMECKFLDLNQDAKMIMLNHAV